MNELQTPPETLTEVWHLCWRLLGRAAVDVKDPLHTMTLITHADPFPAARSVILRAIDLDEAWLECHTDIRSAKVNEIQQHPEISWHAWHPRRRMQLRIQALASCHHQDVIAEAAWRKVSTSSRINYSATQAPGQLISQAAEGTATYASYDALDNSDTDHWYPHFAVIRTQVMSIEWLWLRREGHMRAAIRKEAGEIKGSWRVP